MKRIEVLGHVDEQQRLCLQVPTAVRPGPVKVILEFGDDPDETCWSQAVAQAWAADWSDPREDIYDDLVKKAEK